MKKLIVLIMALVSVFMISCGNETPEPSKPEPKDCKVQLVVSDDDVREYTIKEGEYFSIPDDVIDSTVDAGKAVIYVSDVNARYLIDEKAQVTQDTVFKVFGSSQELVVDDNGTVTAVNGNGDYLAIPNKVGDKEVKAIGKEFLKGKKNAQYIIIQEGVEKIEAGAFKDSSMRWVILPSTIKEVGVGAFEVPGGTKKIIMSGDLKPDWAEGWDKGFEGLILSREYFLDENGLKYEKTLDFEGNEVLIVDGYFNDGVTLEVPATMNGMKVWGVAPVTFMQNNTLKTVILPEGLEYIGRSAFYQSGVSNISLPDSLVYIGDWTFSEMNDLVEIELPDNLKVIPYCAFYNSKSLKKVKFPANLEEISDWGLAGLSLEYDELILPETATKIGEAAFLNQVGIKRIVLPKEVIFTGAMVFYGWTEDQTISFATQTDLDKANSEMDSWHDQCNAVIKVREVPDGGKE